MRSLEIFCEFGDRNVTVLPFLEESLLHGVPYLPRHVGNGLLLAGIIVLHAAVTEEVGVGVAHDVVKLVERAVGLLGVLSVVDCLVVPVLIERHEVVVVRQNLLFEREVFLVEHPVGEVLLVDEVVAVVAVALLVGKAWFSRQLLYLN